MLERPIISIAVLTRFKYAVFLNYKFYKKILDHPEASQPEKSNFDKMLLDAKSMATSLLSQYPIEGQKYSAPISIQTAPEPIYAPQMYSGMPSYQVPSPYQQPVFFFPVRC